MKTLSLVLLTLMFSGYGTFAGSIEYGISPFRGVEYDVKTINDSFKYYSASGVGRVLIFDIPLSLGVDLAMLPISIPAAMCNSK